MKTYRGVYADHESWVTVEEDGETRPLQCQPIVTGGPVPFDWGYGWKNERAAIAPAPATLSYSLLYDAFGPELARKYWLRFLKTFISKLTVEQPWEVSKKDLNDIIATMKRRLL